jgi:hypothetical protein
LRRETLGISYGWFSKVSEIVELIKVYANGTESIVSGWGYTAFWKLEWSTPDDLSGCASTDYPPIRIMKRLISIMRKNLKKVVPEAICELTIVMMNGLCVIRLNSKFELLNLRIQGVNYHRESVRTVEVFAYESDDKNINAHIIQFIDSKAKRIKS